MAEINGSDFGVNQIHYGSFHAKQNNEITTKQVENDKPQLKDSSDPKAEALGRSMLFKGIDDTNHDLKVLLENPQIAENSDKAFETSFKALKDAGIENPYEEAASFSTTSM